MLPTAMQQCNRAILQRLKLPFTASDAGTSVVAKASSGATA
jgi:hypothetical protein